jgi:hypothetical protein
MSGFDRISEKDAIGIHSAAQMERFLSRRDIVDLPAEGWMTLVATCNAGMVGAESGEFDASAWADLLVCALDKAYVLGRLTQGDVLQRRMVACAASLNYFGALEGSPARDPKKAFMWLVAELGGSRQEFLRRCEDLTDVRPSSSSLEDVYHAVKWRSSVVGALKSLCKIEQYVDSLPLKSEVLEWCELADVIPKVGTR